MHQVTDLSLNGLLNLSNFVITVKESELLLTPTKYIDTYLFLATNGHFKLLKTVSMNCKISILLYLLELKLLWNIIF